MNDVKACPVSDSLTENNTTLEQLRKKGGDNYYDLKIDKKEKEIYTKYYTDITKISFKNINISSKVFYYNLPFIFPFYGHPVQEIRVLSNGYVTIPFHKFVRYLPLPQVILFLSLSSNLL